MTLNEACERGILKLRHDPWEPWSHIEIHITDTGHHGPWVKVRSGHNVPAMEGVVDGAFEESVLFSSFDWDEDIWEAWAGPGQGGGT